jgi:hypothetical protein
LTRRRLRALRAHQSCLRYFGTLNGRRPSAKMVTLANQCGFSKDRDVPVLRTCHKKKSRTFRRFQARIRFFSERSGSKWLLPRDFEQRPYFDETLGRPSGYTEILLESGEVFCAVIDRKARFLQRNAMRRDVPPLNEGPGQVIPFPQRRFAPRPFIAKSFPTAA